MRLVCISDTHTYHRDVFKDLRNYINPNDFNILIHSGDISFRGTENEVTRFIYDLMNIDFFDYKIFISGNHDWCFQKINEPHHKDDYDWLRHLIFEENLGQSNIIYLEDNHLIISLPEFSRPLKIYGTPWQPEFHNWAFNLPRNGEELESKWNMIPKDTDILITHTPPHGIGDYTLSNIRVGCELLRFRVEQINPLVHIYGHIHEGYGVKVENKTIFVNASSCDRMYNPVNLPQIIEIKEYYGEIIASHIYAE
jgi:predicted phosphodiesterase